MPITTTDASAAAGELAVTLEIANVLHLDVTVSAGGTVTWVNKDPFPHTTTSGSPETTAELWDSGQFSQNGSYSFTFNQTGTFPYYCTIHPSMTATVTVVEKGLVPSATLAPSDPYAHG